MTTQPFNRTLGFMFHLLAYAASSHCSLALGQEVKSTPSVAEKFRKFTPIYIEIAGSAGYQWINRASFEKFRMNLGFYYSVMMFSRTGTDQDMYDRIYVWPVELDKRVINRRYFCEFKSRDVSIPYRHTTIRVTNVYFDNSAEENIQLSCFIKSFFAHNRKDIGISVEKIAANKLYVSSLGALTPAGRMLSKELIEKSFDH
jgi:hypothetical protein